MGGITQEALVEECRFILANVLAESRYGRKNKFTDIAQICQGAISIPFEDYIEFLEKSGYLRHDRKTKQLKITSQGETVVNGGSLTKLTDKIRQHFDPGAEAKPAPVRKSSASVSSIRDRYEKISTIGTGGVGTVYRARHVVLGREVALKEIREAFALFTPEQHKEIVRRFRDVMSASSSIAHPNVNPVFDASLEEDAPFVVSGLAGSSVRQRLNKDEEIPVAHAVKYLLQALRGLQAGHDMRIYHRGIKPEQLLLDAHDNVLISDFGMSRIVERDSSVVGQVYVGKGNIAYMAPELYSDPGTAAAQADIYALGIIFYELLTRRLPGRRSPMPSQANAAVPEGLDEIFDKMTQDSRSERYSTVEEVMTDIYQLDELSDLVSSVDMLTSLNTGNHSPESAAPGTEGGPKLDEDRKAQTPKHRLETTRADDSAEFDERTATDMLKRG